MAAKSLATCVFCKIIKGEIPSFKLVETKLSYSFLDIGPISKGHAMVIPKYHAAKLHELPDEYLADALPIAKKIALAQGVENYNVLQNNGALAHQVVPHVHFHVIPKPNETEGLIVGWPTQEMSKDDLIKPSHFIHWVVSYRNGCCRDNSFRNQASFKAHSPARTAVETVFFSLNMALFLYAVRSSYRRVSGRLYGKATLDRCAVRIFVPFVVRVSQFATTPSPLDNLPSQFTYLLQGLRRFRMSDLFSDAHNVVQSNPTPAYAFLADMLVGVVAFNVLKTRDPADPRAIEVLVLGYLLQGHFTLGEKNH
ncbi:hypothetical protein D9757_008901 [Collybiopsis confluens]|uniref:HIT domain-containing protein n=1 Tax=Collybiopsis confluens TaxID=2823264 RepID=A0A8H5H5J0_9AGAR|nr:hypothetical protein D9757_008901 [Collybiopsis confluens]